MNGCKFQFVTRQAVACIVGALLIAPSAQVSPAAATSCAFVPATRGTLAEVVAEPGLILVANVVAIHQGGTPMVDTFAVQEIIRPPAEGQSPLDGRIFTTPSLPECWMPLLPGDRIIAIFPQPDTLTPLRSVVWRVGSGGLVQQISFQDVTEVPSSATALIDALRWLTTRAPNTSTEPSRVDGAASVAELVLLGLVSLASSLLAWRPRWISLPRDRRRGP